MNKEKKNEQEKKELQKPHHKSLLIISLHCDKYVHKHIFLSILYEESVNTKQ